MTAQGKRTVVRLRPGDRVLVTGDRTKASTVLTGDWHPARVKTGVVAATVTALRPRLDGRRRRYDVVTDVGTAAGATGAQTFLLAPAGAPAPGSGGVNAPAGRDREGMAG